MSIIPWVSFTSINKTIVLWSNPPLDSATYRCPWENTGLGKHMPKLSLGFIYSHCILQSDCLLFTLEGKDNSDGVKSILVISPIFPICDPFIIWTFYTSWFMIIFTVVSSHNHELMSKYLNDITDPMHFLQLLIYAIENRSFIEFKNIIGYMSLLIF